GLALGRPLVEPEGLPALQPQRPLTRTVGWGPAGPARVVGPPARGGDVVEVEQEWVARTSATSTRAGHGPHPCQGLYHRPAGARPRVACIATHYNVDFSEHYLAALMAER